MSQSRTTNAARGESKSLHCDNVPASRPCRRTRLACRLPSRNIAQLKSSFAPQLLRHQMRLRFFKAPRITVKPSLVLVRPGYKVRSTGKLLSTGPTHFEITAVTAGPPLYVRMDTRARPLVGSGTSASAEQGGTNCSGSPQENPLPVYPDETRPRILVY